MRTFTVDEASSADDVRNDEKSSAAHPQELAETLEVAIDRARKLVAQYETGRLVVRDAVAAAASRQRRRAARR